MTRNRLPTSRAIRLAEGLEVTDWEGINDRFLARIAGVDKPAEYWKEEFVHAWVEKRRLGNKVMHWARLVGMAAGIPVSRNPSDQEAEAILIGWATTAALKLDELGRLKEEEIPTDHVAEL